MPGYHRRFSEQEHKRIRSKPEHRWTDSRHDRIAFFYPFATSGLRRTRVSRIPAKRMSTVREVEDAAMATTEISDLQKPRQDFRTGEPIGLASASSIRTLRGTDRNEIGTDHAMSDDVGICWRRYGLGGQTAECGFKQPVQGCSRPHNTRKPV